MRLGKLFTIALVVVILFCEAQSMPFLMSMGQAIGGVVTSIWKAFDKTPETIKNQVAKKRASASASTSTS